MTLNMPFNERLDHYKEIIIMLVLLTEIYLVLASPLGLYFARLHVIKMIKTVKGINICFICHKQYLNCQTTMNKQYENL